MQNNVNKEQWVAMFKEIGMTDETMMKWHRVFEKRHPDGHTAFLKWLGISSEEINKIRAM
jgi:hypothetical protein